MKARNLHVLVIGGGGREHAICGALARSSLLGTLACAPGNPGIATVAECVDLPDTTAILAWCKARSIDLVVVGPEQPLVDGLADALRAADVAVFGPSAAAAQLEGSKNFTKALCMQHGIPTAAYRTFTALAPAREYLNTQSYPLVIKADGLASGKGVVIAANVDEAHAALEAMFGGVYGAAGQTVVIEECLQGEELSFFAISDGITVREFASAQDHKRAFDGDRGPNTGGMGTYSPSPLATPALRAEIMERIILPSVRGMAAAGVPFQGMLFAGLMLTSDGPKLLEYNTRFGDPETQVMLPRLESDLLSLLYLAATGRLADADITFSDAAAVCVVIAAQGYPGDVVKGTVIGNLAAASAMPGVAVFHASTRQEGDRLLAAGGRVLGISALGHDLQEARTRAYAAVDQIDWPEGFFRRDIAARAFFA